jgi:hypothetical protein
MTDDPFQRCERRSPNANAPGASRKANLMIELLRTNDLVLISAVEATLSDNGIEVFIADQFMSATEGSLGFLPRRVLVQSEDAKRAREALLEAGFARELWDV